MSFLPRSNPDAIPATDEEVQDLVDYWATRSLKARIEDDSQQIFTFECAWDSICRQLGLEEASSIDDVEEAIETLKDKAWRYEEVSK